MCFSEQSYYKTVSMRQWPADEYTVRQKLTFSFSWWVSMLCHDSVLIPLRLRWVESVWVSRCNLPTALLQNGQSLLRATAVTRGWNGQRIGVSTANWYLRRKFSRRYRRLNKMTVVGKANICFFFVFSEKVIITCIKRTLQVSSETGSDIGKRHQIRENNKNKNEEHPCLHLMVPAHNPSHWLVRWNVETATLKQ